MNGCEEFERERRIARFVVGTPGTYIPSIVRFTETRMS